jgi:hypothetical protein
MAKQKPAKVPVSRVRQMADSLMDKSKKLKDFGYDQISIGKARKKNNTYDSVISWEKASAISDSMGIKAKPDYLTGRDHYNRGRQALKQASADSTKAVRFRALADKASAGRDTPLPSSDGIIGTITNKISELFK